ncbi:MAG: hypothetical protein QGH52_05685, partial [Prochlorococcaceae cyanobacterium ETNP1_MAG_8]|nr:hypothetical protein [Prochlorococcaceae cyanobacterium ETNP1_MAG_8]
QTKHNPRILPRSKNITMTLTMPLTKAWQPTFTKQSGWQGGLTNFNTKETRRKFSAKVLPRKIPRE